MTDMELPRLETERLIIRAPCEGDLQAMPGVFHDPDIYAYTRNIPYPYGPQEAVNALARYTRLAAGGDAFTFFPELKSDGALIGLVVLAMSKDRKSAELGYAIGRQWWGNGYATEASGAMLKHGFESLGLHVINAHAMLRNPASSNVLRKLEMHSAGVICDACEKDGEHFDAEGFTMSCEQWESAKRSAAE